MRGRMATNCGWALEYIDGLGMSDVMEMSRFWTMEPPSPFLLKGLTGYKEHGEVGDERLFTQTVSKAKPFDRLPEYLQKVIIERSGLSEVEFHRQRLQKRREALGIKKNG